MVDALQRGDHHRRHGVFSPLARDDHRHRGKRVQEQRGQDHLVFFRDAARPGRRHPLFFHRTAPEKRTVQEKPQKYQIPGYRAGINGRLWNAKMKDLTLLLRCSPLVASEGLNPTWTSMVSLNCALSP